MLPLMLFAAASSLAKDRPAPAPPKPAVVAPAEIAADPANRLTLALSNGKSVVIQLRPDVAPQHVARIQGLVRQGFYNGLQFHRVIPGFMAQGGDPKGDGTGGSTLPDLKAEFSTIPYMRGTAAMARGQSDDSANSQFFVMFSPNVALWGKYTVFGRVIQGMDAVDAIAVGEPPEQPTKILSAKLGDIAAPQTAAATPNGQ
ncbi:MAG: peptidylprolyl isomerase [Sphingomicrobium sp.]